MYPPDCMGSSMQAGEVLEPRTVLLEFPIHMERTAFRSAVTRSIRSEEHTSELQSRLHLVCRLLLEKKKKKKTDIEPFTSQPRLVDRVNMRVLASCVTP